MNRTDADRNESVFAGLTIVGFSWAMVGPLTMKFFADYGATVVRIESAKRPCVSRTSAPYKDGTPGLNRSGYFNHFSANMYGMALDMSSPKGLEVAKRLIGKADVVMENFTPGVMERWGLGYEELKKIKQDIIMVRQSGFGSRGRYTDLAAFGMTLAAIAGIPNYIGWEDREPLPVGVGAYTDCISPRYAAAALIAALDHRDETGKGQLIELAQFETALSFLLPGVLDCAANGREPSRVGNRNPSVSPHGVYPCSGEDVWCTIAVQSDREWERFCGLMGRPELARDSRFATLLARKQNEDAVDQTVSDWTRTLSPGEVVRRLQEIGVAAGEVNTAQGVYEDPQLRERNLFWPIQHSEIGEFTHLGTSFELLETPAEARMPSPGLGEHTEYVCRELIGMPDEEFVELLVEGVFQ